MDNKEGVWRTIRGRRVFIAKGESLGQAMSKSGKFKREDIREGKQQLRRADRVEKTLQKPNDTKLRRKMTNKGNRYERDVFENKQAEKNRINENAHIEGSGQTRIQRNWNKYSEADRREHRHELIQKKLEDYKAKKQSNIRDYKQEQKDLLEDMTKVPTDSLEDYRKTFNEQGKKKFVERIDKELARRKAREDSMSYEAYDKQTKQGINNLKDMMKQSNNIFQPTKEDLKEMQTYDRANDIRPELSNNKQEDYYKGTKRWGFGMANDDNIPVYNNKIDYTGDFTHANLSKVSDDDLTKILNKQSELYHEASNRQVGDRRTRNGKNDEIFKKTDLLRYENGMNKINEEMQKRNMPRYNIYNNKTNTIMASSPTKEMADRQLKEMYDTDKKLGEHYGWKEYPEYSIKQGYVDDYLNEVKKETIKNYVEKKKSNNNINYTNINKDDTFEVTESNGETITMKVGNKMGNGYYAEGRAKNGGRITKLVSDEEYEKLSKIDKLYAIPYSKTKNWKKKGK